MLSLLCLSLLLLVAVFPLWLFSFLAPSLYKVWKMGTVSPGFWFLSTTENAHLMEMTNDLSRSQRKKGWYHTWMGPEVMAITNNADYARALLTTREGVHKKMATATIPESMRSWNTENVVLSEGETWSRQRSVLNPAFSTEAYRNYFPEFQKVTKKTIEVLKNIAEKSKGVVDTKPFMYKFTLDLLGRSILHYDFHLLDGDKDQYYKAYETVFRTPRYPMWRFFGTLLDKLPIASAREFHEGQKKLTNLFSTILEDRKIHPNQGRSDMLDYIIDALKKGQLSEAEVFSNLWIFFIAGHDTTATALSWELQMLIRFPEEQEKIFQEINSVVGDRDLVFDDLKKLKQLDYFVKETLRLYPPVVLLQTRSTIRDLTFGDVTIPKDTLVGIDIRSIHHDERYWEDPEMFDTSRWTPERLQPHHRYTYLPFSYGKRECIGTNFSLQEQYLFLASLLQEFRLEVSKHSWAKEQTRATIFNSPEHGFVKLVPRKTFQEKPE